MRNWASRCMPEDLEPDTSCYGRESVLYGGDDILTVLPLEDYTQVVNCSVTHVSTSHRRCNATVRLPILNSRVDLES